MFRQLFTLVLIAVIMYAHAAPILPTAGVAGRSQITTSFRSVAQEAIKRAQEAAEAGMQATQQANENTANSAIFQNAKGIRY